MMTLSSHCRSHIVKLLALPLLVGLSAPVFGLDFHWIGGTGNWTNGSNWDQDGFLPEAVDEGVGIIGSNELGATQMGGVAEINSAAPDSAGVVLGRDADTNGTLRVLSGGSITFVDSSGAPTGTANIGLGGTGTLDIRRSQSPSHAAGYAHPDNRSWTDCGSKRSGIDHRGLPPVAMWPPCRSTSRACARRSVYPCQD